VATIMLVALAVGPAPAAVDAHNLSGSLGAHDPSRVIELDGKYYTVFSIISDHVNKPVSFRTDGDLNDDGIVDYDDFHLWKNAYANAGAGSSLSVPEPSAMSPVIGGGVGWAICRTRFCAKATVCVASRFAVG
jgi:hypothetical protein